MKCLNCKNLGWGEEHPSKKFFGWCEEVCDAPELDRERECEHFVQATNSDIIRRMSDEELADIFLRADFCKCCEHERDGVCNYICAYPNIPLYDGCKQAALKWMKHPAKEDT